MIYELGSFAVELLGRRRRRFDVPVGGSRAGASALLSGDRGAAAAAVGSLALSPSMASTGAFIIEHARTAGGDHELNKALADFDFDAQRRLGRTRMLVRAGPALGLMGTLIPLSPALTGLANGNTAELSHESSRSLQRHGRRAADRSTSRSAISLSRDRIYGQDLSDLQYLAAVVSDPRSDQDAT